MKSKDYIMIGSPIITKELFRKVLRPLNNFSFKPSGGFWACHHISNIGNISDWITYLIYEAGSIARYKNLNQSTIFTLKEDSKILTIDTTEIILELAAKYPSYHHILGHYNKITEENTIFDFEKLSQDYDGIYIDFDSFHNQFKTCIFDKISVNSLLLFNLDCIKEYQTAPIVYDIDNPYSIPHIIPSTVGEPKKIEEESYEHKILSIIIEKIFLDMMNKYTKYAFKDYDEYLQIITQNIKKVISIIQAQEENKINEIIKLLESKQIIIKKEQLIQTLVLNFLSEYLMQDSEKIETLPKTKIKTPKSYSIL